MIVITTVGFLALINLQVGTMRSVGNAKSMMQAVNLGEHFIETLKSESLSWNGDGTMLLSFPARYPHLHQVGNAVANGGSTWLEGYTSSDLDRRFGPMGNDDTWDAGVSGEFPALVDKRFCLHYRLSWIIPNWLIRADVRVLWMKNEADMSLYQSCGTGTDMHRDLANVSSITIPGMVMRNVFAQ